MDKNNNVGNENIKIKPKGRDRNASFNSLISGANRGSSSAQSNYTATVLNSGGIGAVSNDESKESVVKADIVESTPAAEIKSEGVSRKEVVPAETVVSDESATGKEPIEEPGEGVSEDKAAPAQNSSRKKGRSGKRQKAAMPVSEEIEDDAVLYVRLGEYKQYVKDMAGIKNMTMRDYLIGLIAKDYAANEKAYRAYKEQQKSLTDLFN